MIYVVSWTKGLRYRPNRKQCRESRGIVGYINVSSVFFLSGEFRGKGLRDPGHGRFGTRVSNDGKSKETLKAVLVEKPERTDAKGVQSVS